jgi:hypothetical protein
MKYSSYFPDLQGKICKTYLDGLSDEKALTVIYGAMVGLSALGSTAIQSLILPNIGKISARLEKEKEKVTTSQFIRKRNDDVKSQIIQKKNNEKLIAIERCRQVLLHVLGRYMISCMEMVIPSIEITAAVKGKGTSGRIALCDLEEELVPYYVSCSDDIDHARTLFI